MWPTASSWEFAFGTRAQGITASSLPDITSFLLTAVHELSAGSWMFRRIFLSPASWPQQKRERSGQAQGPATAENRADGRSAGAPEYVCCASCLLCGVYVPAWAAPKGHRNHLWAFLRAAQFSFSMLLSVLKAKAEVVFDSAQGALT